MYKCNKCSKKFKYNSEFIRHQNKKNPCIKENLRCNICNIKFSRRGHMDEHNKTKKHLTLLDEYNKKNNIEVINLEDQQINIEDMYKELKNKYQELENKYNKLENKYNELEIDYNKLKIENKLILENQNNNESISDEYIYVIHERTFLKLNANIYKIGRTKNLNNRINGYTKGSKYLFTTSCKDAINAEKCILNYLKENEKYIQVKDYGNEYFRCNLNELKSDILHLINSLDL